MTYDNRINRVNWFFRKAFKDWPFTTWTAIVLILGVATLGIIWPLVGIIVGCIVGGIAVIVGIIFVIGSIYYEFQENL
ncbi:hypothetical protein SEA_PAULODIABOLI_298 [Microbacterium phage PauloDiaboli]|nr:hypothetical protein SEA_PAULODIABOLI_298 [Microbacterium phage PauloDiaboli]QWY84105.1 hypothetical protein SEA_A3WALLY_298 [Microbacterium phage A3Wally]